jgi:hypothetical protein
MSTEIDFERPEERPVTPTDDRPMAAAPLPATPDSLAPDSIPGQPGEEELPTTNAVLTVTPILEHPSVSDPSPARFDLNETTLESPGQDHLSDGTNDPSPVTAEFLAAETIIDHTEGLPATPTGALPPTAEHLPATPDSMITEINLERPEERPVTPTDERSTRLEERHVTPTDKRTTTAAPLPATLDSLATNSIAGQPEEEDPPMIHAALPAGRLYMDETVVESSIQGQLSDWTVERSPVTADTLVVASVVAQPPVEQVFDQWLVMVSLFIAITTPYAHSCLPYRHPNLNKLPTAVLRLRNC